MRSRGAKSERAARLVKSNVDELPTCPLSLTHAALGGQVETVSLAQKPVRAARLTSRGLQSAARPFPRRVATPDFFTRPLDPAHDYSQSLREGSRETASSMSAPPGPPPHNAASSATFPVATVGVAGMTAEKIAKYTQLQAGYRAGQLRFVELAELQVYVTWMHREVALHHRELERELETAFQAALAARPQQPAAAAAAPAPTVPPATSGDATKIFQFPPAGMGIRGFTDAHVRHYYQLQDEYRAGTISRDNYKALQQYVNVLNKERPRDSVVSEDATVAQAPTTKAATTTGAAAAPVATNAKASGARTAASKRAAASSAATKSVSPPPARKRKSEPTKTTSSTSVRRTSSNASDPALIPLIVRQFDPIDGSDLRDLLHLSRVNKAWRTPALQRLHAIVPIFSPESPSLGSLYELVNLTLTESGTASKGKGKGKKDGNTRPKIEWSDSEGSEDDFAEGPGDGPASKALDKAAMRLYHAYVKLPSLAALPTELLFYGPFEFETSARAVRRFLQVCPNIRKLRLNFLHRGFVDSPYERRYEPHGLVLRYAAEAQPLIQSIELARVSDRNWDMIPALRAFKELKHLSITYGETGQAVELLNYDDAGSRTRSVPFPTRVARTKQSHRARPAGSPDRSVQDEFDLSLRWHHAQVARPLGVSEPAQSRHRVRRRHVRVGGQDNQDHARVGRLSRDTRDGYHFSDGTSAEKGLVVGGRVRIPRRAL